MPRHLLAGAAIVTLSLAACNPKPVETEGAATPAEQAATPDANPAATIVTPANEAAAPDFVSKAGASDMFEIESAKVALKSSTNADVKAFAQMMIDGHTKSTAALREAIAGAKLSVAPPVAMPTNLRNELDKLNQTQAKDFDKTYLDQQVDAHQNTLNLMQRYAQDGDTPALKSFATATAPVVQQHYDRAKALRDAMK